MIFSRLIKDAPVEPTDVLVGRNLELFRMRASGDSVERLTFSPGLDYLADWSPDGRQIVFETYRMGNADLYLMNADGGNQRPLTSSQSEETAPSWSPDGETIAFARETQDGWSLALIGSDGSSSRDLEQPRRGLNPTWSPDGRHLAYSDLSTQGSEAIFRVRSTGVRRVTVANLGRWNFYSPDW